MLAALGYLRSIINDATQCAGSAFNMDFHDVNLNAKGNSPKGNPFYTSQFRLLTPSFRPYHACS